MAEQWRLRFSPDLLFLKFQIAGQDQVQLRVRLCHKSERETFRPVCTRTPDGWTA